MIGKRYKRRLLWAILSVCVLVGVLVHCVRSDTPNNVRVYFTPVRSAEFTAFADRLLEDTQLISLGASRRFGRLRFESDGSSPLDWRTQVDAFLRHTGLQSVEYIRSSQSVRYGYFWFRWMTIYGYLPDERSPRPERSLLLNQKWYVCLRGP